MFSNVHIVLVNPSHPGNIGSTARAMKTMGFNNLSLVNPKEFPSTHADALAVGCVDILSKAKLFDDISSAVEGSNINIGLSARPRRALIPSLSIDECISYIIQNNKLTINLIFGNESSGLSNDDLLLCDHIVSVNPPMYKEVMDWYHVTKPDGVKVHGPDDISDWNYADDLPDETPKHLKIYKVWRGANKLKWGNKIKTHDFTENRGSGCSAILLAAEAGYKHVIFFGFDILGARQWEMDEPSRIQNNCYKETVNYPQRESMKAYMKYEWLYQIRQTTLKFTDTNFYFINRREYIERNHFLRGYFDQPNIKVGIYADLQRWISGQKDDIRWRPL